MVCAAIERQFCDHYQLSTDLTAEMLTENSPLLAGPEFQRYYDQLSDWNWRFGRTPEFSHNMETRIEGVGMFDVHCQVTDAKITKLVIFTDALLPLVIDKMIEALQGVAYTPEAVRTALEPLKQDDNMLVDSFARWFSAEIAS